MAWWLMVGCGVQEAWNQPPAPEEEVPDPPSGVCVGFGETDHGDDGVVEGFASHQVADTWEELTSWPAADPDQTTTTRREYDEHGAVVLEVIEARYGDDVFRQTTTWERDDQGRELVATQIAADDVDGVGSGEGESRTEYTWDGPLLVRIDSFWNGDLVQVIDHRYDPDGRLVEELLTPGLLGGPAEHETRTRTYFEPAPSLDHHGTEDTNSDGLLETEADWYYDEAGRPLRAEVAYLGWGSTWIAAYTYDEAGRQIRLYQEWASSEEDAPTQVTETFTTWDADGHVLETLTQGTSGTVRATWSWVCP